MSALCQKLTSLLGQVTANMRLLVLDDNLGANRNTIVKVRHLIVDETETLTNQHAELSPARGNARLWPNSGRLRQRGGR